MIIYEPKKRPPIKNELEEFPEYMGFPDDDGEIKIPRKPYIPPAKITRNLLKYTNTWEPKVVIIRGERGVGKTTLMQDAIELLNYEGKRCLYIRADEPSIESDKLYESTDNGNLGIVDLLYIVFKKEVDYLFIDEAQTNQTLIKTILDMFCSAGDEDIARLNPYLTGAANKLSEDSSEKDLEKGVERFLDALDNVRRKIQKLNVVFSGTPLLYIKESSREDATTHLSGKKGIDISKYTKKFTAAHYVLAGLSFREYLEHFYNIDLKEYSLDDIFEGKVSVIAKINPEIYFEEYLKTGYYPFAKEIDFQEKLTDAINKTIYLNAFAKDEDAQEKTVNWKKKFIYLNCLVSTKLDNLLIAKLMRLLKLVASETPYSASDIIIADELKCSRNDIPEMLAYLEKVGLISCYSNGVYIKNAALNCFLGDYMDAKFSMDNKQEAKSPSNGLKHSLDEICKSFFLNQVSVVHNVVLNRGGRFSVGNYSFSFSPTQKKTTPDALKKTPSVYVKRRGVQDEVEVPIWQFGLLY